MTHKLYKSKEEIENWLNQYNIKNYEIIEDVEYSFVVNVNNLVNLNSKKLKEIKVKFNIIKGGFGCSYNELRSLYGCPEEVKGLFDCSYNQLKNLKYIPKIIDSNMWVNNNYLNTLEFIPEIVKGLCFLDSNLELNEIQNIENFKELKNIHDLIVLNKKLDKEITINNDIKTDKIKI